MRPLTTCCGLIPLLLSACVTVAPQPPAPPPPPPQAVHMGAPVTPQAAQSIPMGIFWFRDSAERRAIYVETYRAATAAARAGSAGLAPRSWGVILDIDETVLDNSEYSFRHGPGWEETSWDAWTREHAARRLPGAREFIDAVIDELHGQVILITNRAQKECADTEINLRGEGIRYDRILCDDTGAQDKNPRFRLVQQGTPGGPGPLNVLLWVGDNIRDFPQLSQKDPGDPADYGVHYFVLPNPMYGSWQGNVYQ